jgi:hypothetical protein
MQKTAAMHLQLLFTVVTVHSYACPGQNSKYRIWNISKCSGINNKDVNNIFNIIKTI